jgi:hypothetical protein
MIITGFRVMGNNRVALTGDDGLTRHFMTDETAANWMGANATNLPTLASISPTTAVHGAANTTVTLTGTNFHTTYSEVIVNGAVFPRTFVSATSMTIVLPTLTVPAAGVWNIAVRNQGVFTTVSKPFTFT